MHIKMAMNGPENTYELSMIDRKTWVRSIGQIVCYNVPSSYLLIILN